jgi:hypothetical protein
MKTGWVINFKDGGVIFLSEEAHRDFCETKKVSDISCEEHWFDMQKAKEKYQWIKV